MLGPGVSTMARETAAKAAHVVDGPSMSSCSSISIAPACARPGAGAPVPRSHAGLAHAPRLGGEGEARNDRRPSAGPAGAGRQPRARRSSKLPPEADLAKQQAENTTTPKTKASAARASQA